MKQILFLLICVLGICSCNPEKDEADKQVYLSTSNWQAEHPRIYDGTEKAIILLDDTTFMVIPKRGEYDVKIVVKH